MHLDDALARLALAQFNLGPGQRTLQALGGHGGFSGARLWRCQTSTGDFCLRAWPLTTTTERLNTIHILMENAVARRLSFVPELIATHDLRTWLPFGGRLWEVARWLPGQADFHANPTPARLEAACRALARLHLAWPARASPRGPCPAVLRRQETAQRWQSLLETGWLPVFEMGTLGQVSRRAWDLVKCWLPRVADWLLSGAGDYPQRWCLCDVWHDHLLFEEDRLTGLVDYGEVKFDHVAVDLARMLGSLIGDDEERWQQGVQAYRRVTPLRDEEVELARVLDRTGVILGATNWLRWLYHDGRHFDDLDAVTRRVTALVERMEHWQGGLLS